MTAKLMIVWDYDGAIGQVNASYPYLFDESRIYEEIANVDTILALAREYQMPMTFACLGFAAEPGLFPYHAPDQIRSIGQAGHEVASHSWRHEWFPHLERDQVVKSLGRSKLALETCLRKPGAVQGFVPPFSRPMSWRRRGALSLGDRAWGPGHPGADLGSLLKLVREAGYRWCRVSYRSLWQRLAGEELPGLQAAWTEHQGVVCVPQHYTGFDEPARALLSRAVQSSAPLVVCGHPSGLSRAKEESLEHVRCFFKLAGDYRQKGQLAISTISGSLCQEQTG